MPSFVLYPLCLLPIIIKCDCNTSGGYPGELKASQMLQALCTRGLQQSQMGMVHRHLPPNLSTQTSSMQVLSYDSKGPKEIGGDLQPSPHTLVFCRATFISTLEASKQDCKLAADPSGPITS